MAFKLIAMNFGSFDMIIRDRPGENIGGIELPGLFSSSCLIGLNESLAAWRRALRLGTKRRPAERPSESETHHHLELPMSPKVCASLM